MLAELHLK